MHPAHVEYVKVAFTETLADLSTCSCTRYLSPYYYYQNVNIIYPTTDVEIVRIVNCAHRRPSFVSWAIANNSMDDAVFGSDSLCSAYLKKIDLIYYS